MIMHTLGRQVRFSVSLFLSKDKEGLNSSATEFAGEGLSIFLELIVEVTGEIEPATGFVVNVTEIDKNARELVVPIFIRRIRDDFQQCKHVGFLEIIELLKLTWGQLTEKFNKAEVSKIGLILNPLKKIAIYSGEAKMVYISKKFEFAAMHKLWNDKFSEQRNFEVFGKCANPSGHGHNYTIEVTVKKAIQGSNVWVGKLEEIVNNELIKKVDHKNLNEDVAELGEKNPTIENIASFAWDVLIDKLGKSVLHCVTVWESDRTYCSYYGQT